jgi:3-methyladenine DNA glycosylase AlkC
MSNTKTEKFSLKDELYNSKKIEKIALEIKEVYAPFDVAHFTKEILEAFPKLELKERMYHIRDMLKKYLPDGYEEAVNVLLKALPEELDPSKSDDDFGDFIYAPYSEYVVAYGCTKEHLDFSLHALREITKRFSVEYAIRDFINSYPDETLAMLEQCATSDNYHERRLASEGLRPKLPWAKKLSIAYTLPLRHLDLLYADKTRYVTRSVANHLNDIAKIDAPLVIDTLKRWKKSTTQDPKEMSFIISHALRTLVKEGNVEALEMLGYASNPAIDVNDFTLNSPIVKVGDALAFSFEIVAKEDEALMIDYIIYFQTKAGKQSPKVHKLKKIKLKKGEKITLSKKHPFKANMSTRALYAGEHKVVLQINGKAYKDDIFTLVL